MEIFESITTGVVSSVLVVPLIYILKVTNFLYLNDYVKIKSFLNSYHEYYILNLNQGNNLSCSETSKVFDKKDYRNYEFILMIKDYELYNSLSKFKLITKDDVYIGFKNPEELEFKTLGKLEFKKPEETDIHGNDIILINTNNPIFTHIRTEVNINSNNVEEEKKEEKEHTIQGVTLHHLPYQHVQRVNLQKLLEFNLLTCVEKSLLICVKKGLLKDLFIIILSTLIGCYIGFYIGCVI